LLEAAEAASPVDAVEAVTGELAQMLVVDEGPMERTLPEQTLSCTRRDEGWQVLAPVTERGGGGAGSA
jgi:hypothetical protein